MAEYTEPMDELPRGLPCPNHRDDPLQRFTVRHENDWEWIVQVDCIECITHDATMHEIHIPKKRRVS